MTDEKEVLNPVRSRQEIMDPQYFYSWSHSKPVVHVRYKNGSSVTHINGGGKSVHLARFIEELTNNKT